MKSRPNRQNIERLLKAVDLAIKANGGEKWNPAWCHCDSGVGLCPCEYCAVYGFITTSSFVFV